MPFVVIVLELEDVALAAVVDTCADETREVGEMTDEAPLDLAWKLGLVLALKAEKKLAKKGLFVGMVNRGYESRNMERVMVSSGLRDEWKILESFRPLLRVALRRRGVSSGSSK